jgi:PTH1 family peptidyl-tRNA hydrolase
LPVPTTGTFIVVGLGNPGPAYAATRHNVGAHVLDALAARSRASFKRHRSNAEIAEVHLGPPPAPKAVLAKPLSFMNLSGGPTAGPAAYVHVDPDRIVVVHDELALPLGSIRLKVGGGDNGHNGLRSITKSLGAKDYLRVRIGIGRPPGRQDPADFVLKPFAAGEKAEIGVVVEEAADAVEILVREGLDYAQNRVHAG